MHPTIAPQANNRTQPYFQYLQAALRRYCSGPNDQGRITHLSGIIVTHTDGDHMQGAIVCFLAFY